MKSVVLWMVATSDSGPGTLQWMGEMRRKYVNYSDLR